MSTTTTAKSTAPAAPAKASTPAPAPVKKEEAKPAVALVAATGQTAGKRDLFLIAKQPVTADTLVAALHAGTVVAHKRRETGTLRRWVVLAPGSTQRKAAEALRKSVQEKGFGKATASRKESAATLRRMLVALEYTESLESATAKDRAEMAKAANVNGGHAKPATRKPATRKAKAAPAEEAKSA